jgi:large subunit ribosomal protein L5
MQDNIYLDKVVLNIGIGSTEEKLESAKQLLKKLTGREAAYTKARKRFPAFGIKQGQTIGAVVTLRGAEASEFLKRALEANDYALDPRSIANNSVNFGIKEYIYFTGIKYDPKIGMLGMNVNAIFLRKGSRVERRKIKTSTVGRKHKAIGREALASYLEKNFKAKVAEKEER